MDRNKRFTVISLSLSSFVIWVYILTQVQPNKNDAFLLFTFFLSFIVWLGSALAFLLYTQKVKRGNREVVYAHVAPSVRQGFILATTMAMLLFLQIWRVIAIWDAVLVILVAILFELGLRHNHPTGKRV